MFEDIKKVITRSRLSKNKPEDQVIRRQSETLQKDNYNLQNTTQKTKYKAIKTKSELGCSEKVNSFCFSSGTRRKVT